MKFRPCIDLHDGCVKQIVGSTLKTTTTTTTITGTAAANSSAGADGNGDKEDGLMTNFSTTKPAREFAQLYQRDGLLGGHVIMLGSGTANVEAATQAVQAWPGHLQIGGGINEGNAKQWLDKGASHVIVTSAVFSNGQVDWKRLEAIVEAVGGKERLVLDLSCRKRPPLSSSEDASGTDDHYYVVTDKWQNFTNVPVTCETLEKLSTYCDEFLVHGVDVEGKQCGILQDLVELLGMHSPIPVTYAGGVRSLDDLDWVERVGGGKVDCTVGSALDIFGGTLAYDAVVEWHKKRNPPTTTTTNTST